MRRNNPPRTAAIVPVLSLAAGALLLLPNPALHERGTGTDRQRGTAPTSVVRIDADRRLQSRGQAYAQSRPLVQPARAATRLAG